ncbi:MAG: hypothetical protein IPI14_11900 [Polaromonas sp.]|nr:hypothetical protein [Polaromonas sp.]
MNTLLVPSGTVVPLAIETVTGSLAWMVLVTLGVAMVAPLLGALKVTPKVSAGSPVVSFTVGVRTITLVTRRYRDDAAWYRDEGRAAVSAVLLCAQVRSNGWVGAVTRRCHGHCHRHGRWRAQGDDVVGWATFCNCLWAADAQRRYAFVVADGANRAWCGDGGAVTAGNSTDGAVDGFIAFASYRVVDGLAFTVAVSEPAGMVTVTAVCAV